MLKRTIVPVFILLAGLFSKAQAGFNVTPLGPSSPNVLVSALVGSGVNGISNVTYQGTSDSSGTFTGGSTIIGFDSGIILSTGSAASVVSAGGATISNVNGVPGDSDLLNLAGSSVTAIFDATVLQFDFVPSSDEVTFQYVFTSDEYNFYVLNAQDFNDVFGFFVNGTNVAFLPGTSTVVSINNVNNCVNPSYFIDNSNGQSSLGCPTTRPSANLDTSMWGLTVVLTAKASVNPGVVNHVKLAIGDSNDHFLDSNVFIRANSFSSSYTDTPTPTYTPIYTDTPTYTPTFTYTPTPTNPGGFTSTPSSPTATYTPTFTYTPTYTYTSTYTPTITSTPTFTNSPTATNSPTITNTPTPTCVMHVWPNPFNPKYAWNGWLQFNCLPVNAKVNLYSVSGESVQQLNEGRGQADWDGRNQKGSPCSVGIYFYVVESDGKAIAHGKVLLSGAN